MPKLSIVIPVYNVEDYIEKCLDSIRGQTFTDFEVICVDDGSTDYSGMLCNRYRRIDKRFKVIHQENAGVSSARNRGIDEASGEWLTFVDPDDWINNEFYERLFEAQQKFDADVVHCRTCFVTQNGKRMLP
jgi:glycosyltransferase involved in cell wall biosynthesis